MSNYIIYKAENYITKKCYIGVTSNLNSRIKNHHSNFIGNSGEKLHSMFLEFDFKNINFKVIDSAEDFTVLAEKERYYIEKYDSFKTAITQIKGVVSKSLFINLILVEI